MTIIQSGLRLSISPVFTTLLLHDIQHSSSSNKSASNAVTLNYYDPYYSPESGGYHPVEIRLFQLDNEWYFDYITDFAYMGTIYPELEKEFDVCWSQGYLYHAALEDIDERAGDAFFKLWQENFIQYHKMGCYTLRIEWQHD